MANPPTPSTPNPLHATTRPRVPLYPAAVPHYLGPSPVVVADIAIQNRAGVYKRGFAALSSSLALSVIPPGMSTLLGVDFTSAPRWGSQTVPNWCNEPCDIGTIRIQFPGCTGTLSTYYLLVRRPRNAAPWMGSRLLLGTQFLAQEQGEVWVDFASPSYSPRRPFGELRL